MRKVQNHPSGNMTQEEYLEGIGLVSIESLKSQTEVKRVERRRRTTANPKYNTNGFVELSQLTKRTRRFEEVANKNGSTNNSETSNSHVNNAIKPVLPKRMSLTAKQQQQSLLMCYVCEQTKIDPNLTCETCSTKYHDDCIRVSGSKAPCPKRLPVCPKCVTEKLEAYKLAAFSPTCSPKSAKTSENNSSSVSKFKSKVFSSSYSSSAPISTSSSSSSSSTVIPLAVQKNKLNSMSNQNSNRANSNNNRNNEQGSKLKIVNHQHSKAKIIKKKVKNGTGPHSNKTSPLSIPNTTTATTSMTNIKSVVPKKIKRPMKSKTSPILNNNKTTTSNRSSGKSSLSKYDFSSCATRLSLFSAISGDQSLNKTIMAMSDAAKIVMAGTRNIVLPSPLPLPPPPPLSSLSNKLKSTAPRKSPSSSAVSIPPVLSTSSSAITTIATLPSSSTLISEDVQKEPSLHLTTTTATITTTKADNMMELDPLPPVFAKKSTVAYIPSTPPLLPIQSALSSSSSSSSSSSCDDFVNITTNGYNTNPSSSPTTNTTTVISSTLAIQS